MKTVLLQIEVPERDFCWEHTPPFRICEHFNNDGGHDTYACMEQEMEWRYEK